jgi:hypothetical protein
MFVKRFKTKPLNQFQKKNKLNVLFFGSDEFSVETLKMLHHSKELISNLEVVCPVDQRKGIFFK